MEIDESGWHDLTERLDGLSISAEERDALLHHLVDRLVGHFGADVIECHLGKNDPCRHSMREVAGAALAHLAPVLDQLQGEALARLIDAGEIGTPMPPPWDDHWRSLDRTASWRS